MAVELYFAGWGLPTGKNALYEHGYNRLFSYYYDSKFVDFTINRKSIMQRCLYENPVKCSDSISQLIDFDGLWQYELHKNNWMLNNKLFIDSGAYSAWTQGVKINVDDYINWINARSNYINLYGQVDTIPGVKNGIVSLQEVREAAEKTWENYLYMRPKMNNPEKLLYTFHVNEPIEFLKQALNYRDTNGPISYIALGGMVGKPFDVRRNFLNAVFDVIKKSANPNIKVHAFGMTDSRLLEEFPITSADSTGWLMVGSTGSIMTDYGNIVVSLNQSDSTDHYIHFPDEFLVKFKSDIEKFGFMLNDLSDDPHKRMIYNVRYMDDRVSKIQYRPSGRRTLF